MACGGRAVALVAVKRCSRPHAEPCPGAFHAGEGTEAVAEGFKMSKGGYKAAGWGQEAHAKHVNLVNAAGCAAACAGYGEAASFPATEQQAKPRQTSALLGPSIPPLRFTRAPFWLAWSVHAGGEADDDFCMECIPASGPAAAFPSATGRAQPGEHSRLLRCRIFPTALYSILCTFNSHFLVNGFWESPEPHGKQARPTNFVLLA